MTAGRTAPDLPTAKLLSNDAQLPVPSGDEDDDVETSLEPCIDAEELYLPPKRSLHSAVYIMIWIALSSSVILYNKFLLTNANFPFPVFLTTYHMVFSAIATQLLARTTSMIETVNMDRKTFCKTVLPIGVFFSASLILSNQAYLHLSVAFIQMLKATTPAAVLFVRWLLKEETPTTTTICKIFVIIVGTVILSYGEVRFAMIGFALQMAGVLCEATRLALVQKLLQDYKMDPLCGLYYFAPVCAVFNGIIFVIFELPRFSHKDLQNVGMSLLIANGACAFALNLAVVLLIGKTSSLVLCLSGILKDILIVSLSVVVWQTPMSAVQVVGYVIALFGLFWYKNGSLAIPSDWSSTVRSSKWCTVYALITLAFVAAGSVTYLSATSRKFLGGRHSQIAIKNKIPLPSDVFRSTSDIVVYKQPLEDWDEVMHMPPPFVELPELPVPSGKYHVWTVPGSTGGPEALLQLYIAWRKAGFDVYHSGFGGRHVSVYHGEGMLSEEDAVARLYPADAVYKKEEAWTVITPEAAECNGVNATCFAWMLSVYKPGPYRKISHSYYISEQRDIGLLATFQPYMSPMIWKYSELNKTRENLVLVDRDSLIPLDALTPLSVEFPDLVIKRAVDMMPEDLFGNMSIAKVVVDADLVGMERIVFEGRIAGAVPIVGRTLIGTNRWDLDFLPEEHLFSDHDQLRHAVRSVLKCYECEVAKSAGWIAEERQRRETFDRSVRRASSANAQFVVPYCREQHEEPLLTAVSVLLSMPFSSVDIVLPIGWRADFERETKPFWDLITDAGLSFGITVSESADVGARGSYPAYAAFRCMSGRAMDEYVDRDVRRSQWRTHTIFVGADTVIPREDFQATVIGRFIGLDATDPCKFGTLRLGTNLTAVIARPPGDYSNCYETIAWETSMQEYTFQLSDLDMMRVEDAHRMLGNLCVYPLWRKMAKITTAIPRLRAVCSRYFGSD